MGILFFNWYGYQLLTEYWQQQADRHLEARLDRNEYNESQLLRIKIPLTTLSYYNSNSSFERVYGQVDIGGVRYQYVKRRIFRDSLELLCIPNEMAMKLQRVKNDFFRQANDLQQHNQGKKAPSSPIKSISKDYELSALQVVAPYMALLGRVPGVYTFPYLPSHYPPTDEIPPDQSPAMS